MFGKKARRHRRRDQTLSRLRFPRRSRVEVARLLGRNEAAFDVASSEPRAAAPTRSMFGMRRWSMPSATALEAYVAHATASREDEALARIWQGVDAERDQSDDPAR